jgi:hypothetical protein
MTTISEPIRTRLVGRREYDDGHGGTVLADECLLLDYGKNGITRVFSTYPDITPEENARRIERFLDVAREVWRRTLAAADNSERITDNR